MSTMSLEVPLEEMNEEMGRNLRSSGEYSR
jgi:hypothetical protein